MKVTISRAGGETLVVENEEPAKIVEILNGVGITSFGKLALNGEPASPEDVAEDGDVISEARTPEGA
jgi:hypothetical protein